MSDDPFFDLPPKVDGFLRALSKKYELDKAELLHRIVVNGRISIEEGERHDSWNGGSFGHGITLILPEEIFVAAIDGKRQI